MVHSVGIHAIKNQRQLSWADPLAAFVRQIAHRSLYEAFLDDAFRLIVKHRL
jgi:hypothetical protein